MARSKQAPPPPREPVWSTWRFPELPALPELPRWEGDAATRREIGLIAISTAIILYVLALGDLLGPEGGGWLSSGIREVVIPLIGYTGAWYIVLPLFLVGAALYCTDVTEEDPRTPAWLRGSAIYAVLILLCAIALGGAWLQNSEYYLPSEDYLKVGWLGLKSAEGLTALFGVSGAQVFLIGLAALFMPLTTGLSWPQLFHSVGEGAARTRERFDTLAKQLGDRRRRPDEADDVVGYTAQPRKPVEIVHTGVERQTMPTPEPPDELEEILAREERGHQPIEVDFPAPRPAKAKGAERPARQVAIINTNLTIDEETADAERLALLAAEGRQSEFDLRVSPLQLPYEYPSLRLLTDPPLRTENTENVEGVPEMVERAFAEYGITAYVERIIVGPAITRVEAIPSDGTRMSRIANMEGDLAFHLAAKSVRVEAPIPGKKAVGIEFPNKVKETVHLKEILASDEYQHSASPLTVGLGKDLAGRPIVADLSKMPHLLIAGQTGAGKSVCLNTIIMSLLYRGHPNLIKMILIDPKRVELTVYEGLPHLLVPVVQDVKKAINALNWAILEMEDRYKVLQEARARNISEYNARHTADPLPYIVIVIDELADLMDIGGNDLERLINRLARLARAVGIHLILATQRPDVKVITGQIKANIPTRIAFKVASIVDSKTILDYAGSDKLLGFGDMLFKAIGESKPIRAQGAFVDEDEIHNVITHICDQMTPEYNDDILVDRGEDLGAGAVSGDDAIDDLGDDAEFYDEALQITLQEGKISASMLQRKLRIGYNRAARLVDVLHAKGIIAGPNGARPREVITTAYYESYKDEDPDYDG